MDFTTALAIESWLLWSFGIILVACRIISRCMILGSLRKLQADDWIMLFTVITFTGNVVAINQVAQNGSNYLPPGAAELLTPDEIASAIYGSKMTFVTEEFTLFTTWQVKACLLFLYSRLTLGLKQNLAVKILAGYCAVGFVITQILYLGVWCRPISQYWAVPVSDGHEQCASYINHMITATTFNVSSDLMMLAVPLPLLINTKLPLKRKLILCFVFSLGIFVILAAVLNRYYNFTQPYSPIFLNWYVGETSTAIYVANIPLCWPLLRRMFTLSAFNRSTGASSGPHVELKNAGTEAAYRRNTKDTRMSVGIGRVMKRGVNEDEVGLGFSESEEQIVGVSGWRDRSREEEVVLSPMGQKREYVNSTVMEMDADTITEGQAYGAHEGGITKTVQVTQYSL